MRYWLENKINKGDVVICIRNFTEYISLTYGRSYTVVESTLHSIAIIDDNGEEHWFFKNEESFSLLSEWRYNKLEKLINEV